ncbi:MAG: nuclear transport factor 2 family protein [Pyrinomonadaceae bacterium]
MKLILTLLIALIAVPGLFAQSGVDQKLIDALKVMDRQWIIEAYSSKDLKDFDRIVADDFVITGANGKVLTREQKRANVKGDYSEDPSSGGVFKIDADSHKVRMLGKDTAVSTGFIVENYTWKTQKINGHVHFTNLYLKRKGKWQVVQSHYTNIKLG